MRMLLLGALALLTACVTPPPAPETSRQAWYSATAAYSAAIELAAGYKTDCYLRPIYRQDRCKAIVAKMREIDAKAEGFQRIGNASFVDSDQDALMEATRQLEMLRAEMEAAMAEGLTKNKEVTQ